VKKRFATGKTEQRNELLLGTTPKGGNRVLKEKGAEIESGEGEKPNPFGRVVVLTAGPAQEEEASASTGANLGGGNTISRRNLST